MIKTSFSAEKRKKVGVVADDITGANDIGVMFVRGGYKAGVFSFDEKMTELPKMTKDLDVIVLDTDSRFDEPKIAARKVRKATQLLKTINCDLYHNKTCSVFRGNIGAEFDAMQDELEVDCSFVVLGFPRNKRTTINGIHYVDNVKLDESLFKNDPIHPATNANLVEILASQTNKKVGGIFCDWLDKPISKLKQHIDEMKLEYNYLIFDVRDQKDLVTLSKVLKDEKNICGSSAIGEVLPIQWGENPKKLKLPDIKVSDETGVVIIAGSLTKQTKEQVEYMQEIGVQSFEFSSLSIFNEKKKNELIKDIGLKASEHIKNQKNVLIYTTNKDDLVTATREKGTQLNMSREKIGKTISSSMYEIVKIIHENTGFRKLVIAGGDTSAAIMNGIGIKNMIILSEIEAGVPTMYGFQGYIPWLLVLKSGSFGSNTFLDKAANELMKLQSKESKD